MKTARNSKLRSNLCWCLHVQTRMIYIHASIRTCVCVRMILYSDGGGNTACWHLHVYTHVIDTPGSISNVCVCVCDVCMILILMEETQLVQVCVSANTQYSGMAFWNLLHR